MSTPPSFTQIGPALKSRWRFTNGRFYIVKGIFGYKIMRVERYGHQVKWDTFYDWSTTYYQDYDFKIAGFLRKEVAEITLAVLNENISTKTNIYPEFLADVIACIQGYTLDLSATRAEVKLRLKRKHQEN